MTRVIFLAPLLFGACFSGELGNVNPTPVDAPPVVIDIDAPDLPPPDMGPAAGCVDRGTPAIANYNHAGAGTRAGLGCMNLGGGGSGGCHKSGQEGPLAPGFQFAGTIYKKGTAEPDPGAIIVITPDNPGVPPIQAIADSVGNFYIPQISGNAVPATVSATVCPDLTKGHLVGKIALGTTPGIAGNCNGCHGPDEGATQPRIFVGP